MSDVPPCTDQAFGPCTPLVTVDDLCGECGKLDLNDEDTLALFEAMLAVASERVVMATRGRFIGCCTATIRVPMEPTVCEGSLVPELAAELTGYEAIPLLVDGSPAPVFRNCWGPAGRPSRKAIHLPFLPVRDVLSVTVGGELLDAGDYYVVPGTNLLRLTSEADWPQADIDIVFRHGLDLPPSARPLVAQYACELTKKCLGAECDLPEGIKVLSRPGVQFGSEVILDTDYRREGLTGYKPVDDWVRQVFAGQSRTRPRMWRPRRRATHVGG